MMQSHSDSWSTLRRIGECCAAGKPITSSDATWLASVIEAYGRLAPDGISFDKAAGLVPEPGGGEPWWRTERRRLRDEALRSLATDFHSKLTKRQAAVTIKQQLERYMASAWLIDRRSDRMPPRYIGTEKSYLFKALKAGPVPTGIRQVWSILNGNSFGNDLGEDVANESRDYSHAEHQNQQDRQ